MLNQLTKSFILQENIKVDPAASLQALSDIMSNIRVTNKRDTNRLELAKEHVRAIKREFRNLNERVAVLQDELTLLKEEK
tara:strand:- start:8213 stop:8452 length:240 start_codon:yes stop_codon:yes gene_type:complete